MLSFLELKNFKSFTDITLDLRKSYGEPKKFVFIYGENGSGKSNLLSSLLFFTKTLNTLKYQDKAKEISELYNEIGDSIEDEKTRELIIKQIVRREFYSLSDLIEDYKMLGSEQPMSIKIGFRIKGGFDGNYYMEFSENKITKEELRYRINKREGAIFSFSQHDYKLSPSIFLDIDYKNELKTNIEKYWGKHSFLAILQNEISAKNKSYIESKTNKCLLDILKWVKNLSVWCKESNGDTARIAIPFGFLHHLESGTIEEQNDYELKSCESALNMFFTQLYSDIKAAYYVFSPKQNQFYYELYFKKLIEGKIIEVPFSLESTGTKKLLEIFPLFFSSAAGASVFIDEIDSGIHDLLMKNLLENIEDSINGQFIATTHNTLLMNSLLPENTYIIRINSKGNKTIDCVADYKQRTQKTNSIQNKYLRGDYSGIPNIGYLDLAEIVEDVLNNVNSSSNKDGDEE